MKFKTFGLVAMVASFISGAVLAAQSDKTTQCRRDGYVCAMVCNKGGTMSYSLYEFAHYNAIDKYFERVIQDDSVRSEEAQISDASEKLSKADPELAAEYNANVAKLNKKNGFYLERRKPSPSLPKDDECAAIPMVVYKNGKWIAIRDIYNHFGRTDKSGLVSRMALIKVAMSRSVVSTRLTDIGRLNRYLFNSESNDKILAASHKRAPNKPEELQAAVSNLTSIIFLKPTDQNVAAMTASRNSIFANVPTTPAPAPNLMPAAPAPAPTWNTATTNIIPGSDMVMPPPANGVNPEPAQIPSYEANSGVNPAPGQVTGYEVPQLQPVPGMPAFNVASATNGVALNPDGTPVVPQNPNQNLNPAPQTDPANPNNSAPPFPNPEPQVQAR